MAKKIATIKRQEHLPSPSYVHAMAEINGQTDRGAVIAGTAYLDLLLRSVLERQMRPHAEIQDALFENRGPLQDFSARIQAAFAFKLIGSGAYLDLSVMRDIRNAFAHSIEALSFGREDIAVKCAELWYPRRIQVANKPMPREPREKFMRGLELLAQGFIELAHHDALPSPPRFLQLGPPWPPQGAGTSPKKPRARSSRGRPVPS